MLLDDGYNYKIASKSKYLEDNSHPIVDDPIHNLEQINKIILGIDEKIAYQ
jgi:hypothetical protein